MGPAFSTASLRAGCCLRGRPPAVCVRTMLDTPGNGRVTVNRGDNSNRTGGQCGPRRARTIGSTVLLWPNNSTTPSGVVRTGRRKKVSSDTPSRATVGVLMCRRATSEAFREATVRVTRSTQPGCARGRVERCCRAKPRALNGGSSAVPRLLGVAPPRTVAKGCIGGVAAIHEETHRGNHTRYRSGDRRNVIPPLAFAARARPRIDCRVRDAHEARQHRRKRNAAGKMAQRG